MVVDEIIFENTVFQPISRFHVHVLQMAPQTDYLDLENLILNILLLVIRRRQRRCFRH